PVPVRHSLPTRRSSDLAVEDGDSARYASIQKGCSFASDDLVLDDSAGRDGRKRGAQKAAVGKNACIKFAHGGIRDRFWVEPVNRDRKSIRLNSSHVKSS